MKNKILMRSLIGAPVGLTAWFLFILWAAYLRGGEIMLVSGHGVFVYGSELNAVAAEVAGAMLIGMIWGAATLIYQETDWSLLKQTVAHSLVCMIPSLGITYVMQWMPHSLDGLGQYLRLFGIIYALNWIIRYWTTRKRLMQINAKLKEMEAE